MLLVSRGLESFSPGRCWQLDWQLLGLLPLSSKDRQGVGRSAVHVEKHFPQWPPSLWRSEPLVNERKDIFFSLSFFLSFFIKSRLASIYYLCQPVPEGQTLYSYVISRYYQSYYLKNNKSNTSDSNIPAAMQARNRIWTLMDAMAVITLSDRLNMPSKLPRIKKWF